MNITTRYALLLSATVGLTGCATMNDDGQGQSGQGQLEGATISFETGACFGTCPIFEFTIEPDGSGLFTGKQFVALVGEQAFQASPAQMAAFKARIAPFRPDGKISYDGGNCSAPIVTDLPSVNVTWDDDDKTDEIYWYLGCREPSVKDIQPDLYGAWKELPLKNLVELAHSSGAQR